MKHNIRALLIEKDVTMRKIIRDNLNRSPAQEFTLIECEELKSAIPYLQTGSSNIILFRLSDQNNKNVEKINIIRMTNKHIPIIGITALPPTVGVTITVPNEVSNQPNDILCLEELSDGTLLQRAMHNLIEQQELSQSLNEYQKQMNELAQVRAKQILHQERFANTGNIVTGVANEISGPLAKVKDNSNALKRNWHNIAQWLECHNEHPGINFDDLRFFLKEYPSVFQQITKDIERIQGICDGLHTFSLKSSRQMTQSSIEDCVERALELCQNILRDKIEIRKNYHTNELQLTIQQQKMIQVFIQLFYNAARAMNNDGEIVIATAIQNETLKININDTGPGIPEETLDSIWEPFYSTKPEGYGAGLGLSICKEIVGEHGGEISANNLSTGAQFTITFPLDTESAVHAV